MLQTLQSEAFNFQNCEANVAFKCYRRKDEKLRLGLKKAKQLQAVNYSECTAMCVHEPCCAGSRHAEDSQPPSPGFGLSSRATETCHRTTASPQVTMVPHP